MCVWDFLRVVHCCCDQSNDSIHCVAVCVPTPWGGQGQHAAHGAWRAGQTANQHPAASSDWPPAGQLFPQSRCLLLWRPPQEHDPLLDWHRENQGRVVCFCCFLHMTRERIRLTIRTDSLLLFVFFFKLFSCLIYVWTVFSFPRANVKDLLYGFLSCCSDIHMEKTC